ncbi:ABC transporter ATP-binding protein [Aminipila sp.]|uniref:ABC transporter ATP-binding protein n=1 Tax=Aminipila sp. TaxID=2060095 RepID=UPI00289C7607|nr:ABC transporter ATP-binding protein [Aminipila sp.]
MSENKKITPSRGGPMAGVPMEKPKSFKLTMGKLIQYCMNYLPAMIISLIAAMAGTLLQIIGPDKLKALTNEIGKGLPSLINGVPVLNDIDMNAVVNIAWSLVFLYVGAMLLNYIQSWIMATATQKISKKMRSDISRKINRLPLKYFDQTTYGDVLSRVMAKSQKYFSEQQRELGNINGHIEETYTGHNVVKAYNGSREAKVYFEKINSKLYASAWKSQFLSGLMMPLMGFVGNLGYVAVCVVGAVLTMNGKISFGVIVAFMVYIRLFTQPLSQLAQAFNNLQRTAAAGERVFEVLNEKELIDESQKSKQLENIKGDVEFRNVKFGYLPNQTIIHDFSAKVKAGQKVAIVGPTGAGKTTIVNLLMRFYELDGGEILLDGIPISQTPRDNVHEQFSMVLQDTWLFEGTIRENILYSKQGVTEEQVIAACKTVGLHHFIKTLPDGYNTVLNDKASLSEGQKQLITIARAMIQNAPLLILDEATSSVDTRTERIVQKAMDKLTEGRTSFVIAHRLSTIKNADLILVMKDGDIVESGRHEELLNDGGFYSQIYNSQFE